jgi:glutathione-regulated potassium-efflux system ancillary protein KefC
VRPAFQFLATVRLRESFIAAALLIVVAIALLMEQVGLSPALGTFVAGVVLAESEYRHELEADLEPFKGLLLGLFFISVGAQIDFPLIAREPGTIAGIVVGAMALKLGVLWLAGRMFGLDRPARWLLAFALAQVGEFAFVLIKFGTDSKIFDGAIAGPLVAAVAISMLLTPLLFVVLERWVLPAVTVDTSDARPQDAVAHDDAAVVLAGHGRFGQIVARLLRSAGFRCTILDLDPEIVDVVRRLGSKVYYGDASRIDLLHAAGCAHAKLFVVAIDDAEQATEIVKTVREHFPRLPIFARARDRIHYYELRKLGVAVARRELFGSAVELATEALRALGLRGPHRAPDGAALARSRGARARGHGRDVGARRGPHQPVRAVAPGARGGRADHARRGSAGRRRPGAGLGQRGGAGDPPARRGRAAGVTCARRAQRANRSATTTTRAGRAAQVKVSPGATARSVA